MTDLSGKTLGKYRLLERMGMGGMAQVYKSYHAELDRYVAVKVLHPYLVADEGFLQRFQREGRAIAALNHPNIVQVYDCDVDDGLYFIVMELVSGESLKQYLRDLKRREQLIPLSEVVHLFDGLCGALTCAHSHGVIHRDVKPSNILLRTESSPDKGHPCWAPVLTDFGVAKLTEATWHTASGATTLGTPAYMSPEQGEGKPGDARSDLYALGVLLYQILTGRLPFDADTPYAVVLKHISAPLPAPRKLRPDLHPALERVILKSLAKSPDDRFQSASEFANALKSAAVQASTPSSESRFRIRPVLAGKKHWWVGVATAVVIMLVVGAWWLVGRVGEQQAFIPATLPAPTVELSEPPPVVSPTSSGPIYVVTQVQNSPALQDVWIDPDLPDENFSDAGKVHLQGPSTPDRVLFAVDWGALLPENSQIISATLEVYLAPWGEDNRAAKLATHVIRTPWRPTAVTYNSPWRKVGPEANVDYDAAPLVEVDLTPWLAAEGWLALDVTALAPGISERDNHGLMLRLSDDSFGMAHFWLYTSEYQDLSLRPRLTITYDTG